MTGGKHNALYLCVVFSNQFWYPISVLQWYLSCLSLLRCCLVLARPELPSPGPAHPAASHLFYSVWSCALGSENYDKSWSLLHCTAKFLHTVAFWMQANSEVCMNHSCLSHNLTHMIVADHCARGLLNHRHLFVWSVYSTFLTMQTQETNVKIVTLGKEATGKTALVERFLNDEYYGHNSHQATIAGSFGSKYFSLNSFASGKQTFCIIV